MVIIGSHALKTFSQYYENKVKLKVVHFCPLDGREDDPKSKRIVITSDCSSPTADVYQVVVLYGPLAKTPFKKSALKVGQLFTLQRFHTTTMPKNKVFKCNGQLLKNFFEPLIVVKPDFDPIIKMLVCLRDESSIASQELLDDSSNDSQPLVTDEEKISKRRISTESKSDRSSPVRPVRSPFKKRIRLESSDEEMDSFSDDDFDTDCRRRVLMSSKNVQPIATGSTTNPSIEETPKQVERLRQKSPPKQHKSPQNQSISPPKQLRTAAVERRSPAQTTVNQRDHSYKTLFQVHTMMPVSARTYCHIYGVLIFRDYKQNHLYLRDEKVFKLCVSLRPGSYSREYPAVKPGDIIRIHRLLLAPNTLEVICTDPKDVVVFEGFRDESLFNPIHTSLNPSFDDYDRQRKQELDEWLAEELLSADCLKAKVATAQNFFTDLAVQVIRITPQRERTYLEVWDTTEPALKSFKSKVNVNDLNLSQSQEELVRVINENNLSILVTVFEQHSIDATNIKPFDFIVLFNVCVKVDRFNKNYYIYQLNSSYNFGKCIRIVDPLSRLAKKISSRIDEFAVMSAVNVPDLSSQLGSPSQPIDYEESHLENRATMRDDTMRDSFEVQLNHMDMNDLVPVTESLLPTDHYTEIPNNNVMFTELIDNGVHKHTYKVKARLISYLPSLERKDIVSVYCTGKGCERLVTFSQAIREDPNIQSVVDESTDEKIALNCFQCKRENSCILVLRFVLILEDNRRKKVLAQLEAAFAEIFFKGRTPEDVLRNDPDFDYVRTVLNSICPIVETMGSNRSYNPLNYWVIQALKWDDTNKFVYNVKTAVAIRTVDKCLGHNL